MYVDNVTFFLARLTRTLSLWLIVLGLGIEWLSQLARDW